MRAKSGNAYGILKKRGTILKANFENRFRIGKLNIILLKLKDKKKTNLTNAIISGSKITDVTISFVKDKEDRLKLCRILSRLGLGSPNEKTSFEEVEMNLGNKKVWVPSEMSEKINELNEKFCKISQKIQFKNAEKQIRIFSDVEENEFSKLQTEYLEILKEQDRILKNFEDDPGEFTISS